MMTEFTFFFLVELSLEGRAVLVFFACIYHCKLHCFPSKKPWLQYVIFYSMPFIYSTMYYSYQFQLLFSKCLTETPAPYI